MFNQRVLPAISNMKKFEFFLKSNLEYAILLDMPLEQLHILCNMAHKEGKKCLVHIDLIKGVKSDEHGALYLCQVIGVDGLISTHPPVIAVARKKKKIAIQRIFLIDSMSLEKSIRVANNTKPDYIELLPGIAYSIFSKVQGSVDIPLIGGGLIETKEDVMHCLEAGLVAITTSKQSLWTVEA